MGNRQALRAKRPTKWRGTGRSAWATPSLWEHYVCRYCGLLSLDHIHGKCLFGTTVFTCKKSIEEYSHKDSLLMDILVDRVPYTKRIKLKVRKRWNRW